MRYAFVAEHRPIFSARSMCRCLRIHPSGFYAWLKKPLSKRAAEDVRRENKNGDVTHRRVVHSCLVTGGDQEISAIAYRSCPISYSRTWGKHRADTVVGTLEDNQPSNSRSVRVRYADYEGELSYSGWYSY